jgi:hypothetical protein
MTKTRIDCEDPAISHRARAALLRLRARVARRRGRWHRLRRTADELPPPAPATRAALVAAA